MSGPIVLVLRLLLAASLYGFLAWAFLSLWREIRQQGTLLAARSVPPISLTVAVGDTPAHKALFTQAVVTIGRDPACDCPLEDPAASARHAHLSHHHGQWWLEDLDSTNGIVLNDDKLTMPTVVMSGDEFICGATRITIALPGNTETGPSEKNGS